MMDRDRAFIPAQQIGFMDSIAAPVFKYVCTNMYMYRTAIFSLIELCCDESHCLSIVLCCLVTLFFTSDFSCIVMCIRICMFHIIVRCDMCAKYTMTNVHYVIYYMCEKTFTDSEKD